MEIREEISYGPHEACKLDLYLPQEAPFPMVLFFHGGGMEAGNKGMNRPVFEELARNGIGVASAEYRMYPQARYPEFIEDAARAVKWVWDYTREDRHSGKIFVTGSSAGAYLAMMLCFDEGYLNRWGLSPSQMGGYVFDAGQPTTHFNVLRERGEDTRRVVADEASPLYHVAERPDAPPILLLVSDNDIPNRLEQTRLLYSTLRQFGYSQDRVQLRVMEGYGHTQYLEETDAQGRNVFAQIVKGFVTQNV